ncbi:MAG: hypothetical protein WBP47_24725 [Candidatus Promineifilaceae bacterium]
MKISTQRLLGIALIGGGVLVGMVVMVLFNGYANNGAVTAVTAIFAIILSFLLLVLPQLTLGIYLIWHDSQQIDPNKDI